MPMTAEKIAELRAAADMSTPGPYEYRPVPTTVLALLDEIEALRTALSECAAPWSSPPTTVMGAAQYLSEEFQRRMNLAVAALQQEEADPGVGAGMDGAHVGFARRALSSPEGTK